MYIQRTSIVVVHTPTYLSGGPRVRYWLIGPEDGRRVRIFVRPQANLVTISDGGHDITTTHASEVNHLLLHFLADDYSDKPSG
ncbi:hypothetical protein P692DRAFT_20841907 [Suillus brevipes Sb2]|nr:hypothetical protein P692DRAFT_20841907 [Suillus brevipes Sb2]